MVSIIPFLPSFRWYAAWLSERRKGVDEGLAAAFANTVAGIRGKDFARTAIGGNAGEHLLSVPVAGGSAMLKQTRHLPEIIISEHGNWRHVHLGAMEATYGRMPFYQHLFPEIRCCYEQDIQLLAEFNHRLHVSLCTLFLPSFLMENLPEAAAERGRELLGEVAQDRSIIDTLFRLGPESILPLLWVNNNSTYY